MEVRFRAFHDPDAAVWVAISDEHDIATEAPTRERLVERLRLIVPDVVDARAASNADLSIHIEWQQMQTFETTDMKLDAA